MLDAVQAQLSAISADGANWSVAKVFAFLALVFGILTLLATLYLMWKHKVFRTLESAPKEGVIRTGTSFITTGAFIFSSL